MAQKGSQSGKKGQGVSKGGQIHICPENGGGILACFLIPKHSTNGIKIKTLNRRVLGLLRSSKKHDFEAAQYRWTMILHGGQNVRFLVPKGSPNGTKWGLKPGLNICKKTACFSGPALGRCDTLLVGLCPVILGQLGREKKGGEPVLTRREPSKRAGGYNVIQRYITLYNVI